MENMMHVIDRLLVLRLSLLLGYIISISTPFKRILDFLLQPQIFGGLITYVVDPVWSLAKFLYTEGCMIPLQSIMSGFGYLLSFL
jgi:hypothetical protein